MRSFVIDLLMELKAYSTTLASPLPAAVYLYRALRAHPDPKHVLEAYRRRVPEPIYAVSRHRHRCLARLWHPLTIIS